MKVILRTFRTYCDDLVDADHIYPVDHRMDLSRPPDPPQIALTAAVVKDADEWTPLNKEDRATSTTLEIYAKDELHAFQMWCAYKRGEYETMLGRDMER